LERQDDRRRHPRHPCDREFEGELSGGNRKAKEGLRCHAIDVSEGGMMLEIRDELAVGQKIELFLKARDSTRSFAAEVEVMWCKPYGEVYHCGVTFLSRREVYVV